MITHDGTSNKQAESRWIHGIEYAPQVGACVELDDCRIGEGLLEGDRADVLHNCSEWSGCDFRWPNPVPAWRTSRAIAVNVSIVGRTLQRRAGCYWVRVRLEWVGDCEPSTFSRGWMLADYRSRV